MPDLENRNILRGCVESGGGSGASAVALFQPGNLSVTAPSNHFLCFLRSVREFLNCSARVVGIVASSTFDRRSFADEIVRLGGCERFDKYVVSHVGIIWHEIGSQLIVNCFFKTKIQAACGPQVGWGATGLAQWNVFSPTAIAAMATACLATGWLKKMSNDQPIKVFAVFMILVGVSMLFKKP